MFEIARGGTASWPNYVAEIMKCDVRCATHHAKRHRAKEPITRGIYLGHLTETEFETQHVEPLATMLGWEWVHFQDSRRQVKPGIYVGDSKARGWPDMVLCRDRVIHAELKSATGKLRPQQRVWLDGLADAGGEVYLWRPMDLEEIARILKSRWRFLPRGDRTGPRVLAAMPALASEHDDWTPGSIWIAGQGRADGGS